MDGPYGAMALLSILGSLANLGLMIALIVIASANVRPVDRSASGMLVISAVVSIASLVTGLAFSFLTAAVDVESLETFLTLRSALQLVLGLTAYALLLGGIVRLAKAQRRDPREPA